MRHYALSLEKSVRRSHPLYFLFGGHSRAAFGADCAGTDRIAPSWCRHFGKCGAGSTSIISALGNPSSFGFNGCHPASCAAFCIASRSDCGTPCLRTQSACLAFKSHSIGGLPYCSGRTAIGPSTVVLTSIKEVIANRMAGAPAGISSRGIITASTIAGSPLTASVLTLS